MKFTELTEISEAPVSSVVDVRNFHKEWVAMGMKYYAKINLDKDEVLVLVRGEHCRVQVNNIVLDDESTVGLAFLGDPRFNSFHYISSLVNKLKEKQHE